MRCVLPPLALVLAAFAPAPVYRGKPAQNAAELMHGPWSLKEYRVTVLVPVRAGVVDHRKLSGGSMEPYHAEAAGGTVTFSQEGGPGGWSLRPERAEATAGAAEVDLGEGGGKVQAHYRIEGDTLTIRGRDLGADEDRWKLVLKRRKR